MNEPRYLFIVGCGRSGTTLVYENLLRSIPAYHFTNLENRWPSSDLLSRVAHGSMTRRVAPVIPSEGYPVWDFLFAEYIGDFPESPSKEQGWQPLAARVRGFIDRRLALHGRDVFINKNTRNSTRIPFLLAAFPEARFVHVVRHPIAVVNSLLKVEFWKDMPVSLAGGRRVREITSSRNDEVALASRIWVHETDAVHRALGRLTTNHWIRIAYEEYVEQPRPHLARVAELMGRSVSLAHDYEARPGRNRQFQKSMTPDEIRLAATIVGETAAEYGYSVG